MQWMYHIQHSLPMQEVVCILCNKVETEGVEIAVVDWHVGSLIFMQTTRVCVLLQTSSQYSPSY